MGPNMSVGLPLVQRQIKERLIHTRRICTCCIHIWGLPLVRYIPGHCIHIRDLLVTLEPQLLANPPNGADNL